MAWIEPRRWSISPECNERQITRRHSEIIPSAVEEYWVFVYLRKPVLVVEVGRSHLVNILRKHIFGWSIQIRPILKIKFVYQRGIAPYKAQGNPVQRHMISFRNGELKRVPHLRIY